MNIISRGIGQPAARTLARLLLVPLAAALLTAVPARAREGRAGPVPLADHHMHLQSPLISAWLHDMETAMPTVFDGISDDIFAERSGVQAVAELDRAGIRQGVLLSMGAKILGNIEVGEYSRVGAGSVVLKSIPAGCTAVGIPAKLVNCTGPERPSQEMNHFFDDETG